MQQSAGHLGQAGREVLAGGALALLLLLAALPLVAGGAAALEGGREAVLAGQAARNLAAGELAMRWGPDLAGGHGAPFFLLAGPAGYYLPGLLLLAGASGGWAVLTARLVMGVLSGLLAYRLGRDLGGAPAGTLAAALYLFSPARLGTAAGLAGAAALLGPLLVLGGALRFHRQGRSPDAALVGGGFAWLLLADPGLGLRVGPVLVLYLLALPAGRRAGLLLAGLAGVGCTAFHWVPAWAERSLVWEVPARLPAAAPLAAWVGAGLAVGGGALALLAGRRGGGLERRWALLSVALGAASPLAGPAAAGLLLLAAPVSAALLLGSDAPAPGPARRLAPLALALTLGGAAAWTLTPPAPASAARWDVADAFRARSSPVPAAPRRGPLFPAPAGCRLDQEKSGPALHFFDAVCDGPALMRTGLYDFPGWTVSLDNRRTEPRLAADGTLEIALGPGPQRVKLALEHTRWRRWTRFASLLSLVLGAALLLTRRR